MGNSSSTSGGHGHHGHPHHGGHHKHGGPGGTRYPGYHQGYPGQNGGYDDGWSHSLETPEQRNRMKRGYFPPRAYVGGMPSPQKVLPVGPCVNPNKLLKATSNGAILHGGGTISGRKLTELELEVRKRSTVSCPANNDEMGVGGGGLSSGRSTPNLLMPRMGLSASGNAILPPSSSSSRSRDYGSEPDLRDVGRKPLPPLEDHDGTDDRSSSPLPNSFTLISESPAKKQIRSRKKSKAPPPPPATAQMQFHPHPNDFLIPYQYQLQQNPQRQLLLTPVSPGGQLQGHTPIHPQHLQQMQMQAGGHFGHEEKKRSRLFKTKAESRSAMNSPALRVTPTPAPNNNELISRNGNKIAFSSPSSHPIGQTQENHKNGGSGGNKMKAPNPNSQSSSQPSATGPLRSKSPKPGQIAQQVAPTSGGGGVNGSGQNQSVPKGGNNKNVQGMNKMGDEKKTFYFGMDVGTFKQKNKEQLTQQAMGEDKPKSSSPGQNHQGQISQAHVADLHKEISRRKMIQKLENEQQVAAANQSRSSSRNSGRNNNVQNQNQSSQPQIIGHNYPQQSNKGQPNMTNVNSKVNAKVNANANRASESDSDGIHRRQDSGSFELNAKKINAIPQGKKAPQKIRESSSDLSSSDLDVPLVVTRPTLPQKRPELPRFSPTAAWRAMDSPSRGSNNSGRSFDLDLSGGEGGGDGRLHRFTRPSAPPRISAERSGDSGISAGDAGSPANAIPLLEEDEVGGDPRIDYDDFDDDLSSSPFLPVANGNNVKSSKIKAGSSRSNGKHEVTGNQPPSGNIKGADRKMKCWTPEQDLDESSSDFDQDSDPILPPVPPKPGHGGGGGRKTGNSISSSVTGKHYNLFEGKRASAVVSDSDSKYFGGSGHRAGFSSTDELNHPRRYHGRGGGSQGQVKDGGGPPKQKRFFNPRYRSPAASPASSSTHYKHHGGGGFVGLDTNWFLSRSEPNSLNFAGIEMEDRNFRFQQNGNKKFAPPPPTSKGGKGGKKPVAQKEVIVGRSRKANNNNTPTSKNKKHFQSEDELECELQLDDEFDSLSSSDPTSGIITRNKATASTTVNKKNNNPIPTKTGGSGSGSGNKPHNNKPSSEIGYGPSSMNFNNSSSSAYEDQEEELEMRDEEEEEEEELMRDDLFDYLDQYEEGEFEREQELGANLDGPFGGVKGTENNVITINHRNNNDIPMGSGDTASAPGGGSRPFSHHIMYLPSYDARKIFNQKAAQSWRRTRSVDALDGGEGQKLFKRESSPSPPPPAQKPQMSRERILHIEVEGRDRGQATGQGQPRNQGQGITPTRKSSAPSYLQNPPPREHHVSNVTITSAPLRDETRLTPEEEERRAMNKKKFKFQSTLRVQERRKIEAELSREAENQEATRLREIEEMKRVEEEFQKKRRATAEAEARAKQALEQYPNPGSGGQKKFGVGGVGQGQNPRKSPSPVRHNHIDVNTRVVGTQNGKLGHREYNNHSRMMSQRQEPEGAPASVTVSSLCNSSNGSNSNGSTDLRKELISASKKRSGNPVGGHGQNQTQELSEYRQETRQYCDYRRGNRQQSLSPARFIQKSSSSSDIFPIPSRRPRGGGGGSHSSKVSGSGRSSTTTIAATVHPEVVCDIPVKPHPYMVNASRLSGSSSTMHLVSEERPSSVVGSAQNLHFISGPSSPSVLSGDNYRRDWAHHLLTRGGSGVNGGVGGSGRASSVLSLHSAPTTSPSDNFRNSANDLSRLNGNASPGFGRHRSTSHHQREQMIPNYRQYSASPPPSRSPVPSSTTATDSYHQMSEMSPSSRGSPVRILSSKTNTTVISIGRGPQMMTRPSKKKKSISSSSSPSPISPSAPNSYQAQPYSSNNRTRGYRPVSFKPGSQPQATTTAVN